jgi:glucose/arabinose dehydrogenase
MRRRLYVAMFALSGIALSGCYRPPLIEARHLPPPTVPGEPEAARVVVPEGYIATIAGEDLVDPRAVVMGPDGLVYVVEGIPAGLLRVNADGSLVPVASGGGNGTWTGAAVVGRRIMVAEDGGPRDGRILAISSDGSISTLLDGLPPGTMVRLAAGPDGWLYAGVASISNAGLAGPGEVAKDIPCQDVEMRRSGRLLRGHVPCTGAVLRIAPDGGTVEAYAWGFRRPVGLDFTPDGRLVLAEQSYRPDPARRVAAEPDLLWAVTPGVWYGWPDFHGQLALADPVMADYPNPPPPPLASLPEGVRALGLSRGTAFGAPGQPFVALEGGTVAFVGPSGVVTPFAVGFGDLSALAFTADGGRLWLTDAAAGRLWRITPQ